MISLGDAGDMETLRKSSKNLCGMYMLQPDASGPFF